MPGKTTNRRKSPTERKIEKELLYILGFIAILVVVFLIASMLFKKANQFEYKGLVFTKERFDKLLVYHYYYSWKDSQNKVYQYNLYLRTDPRENTVPIYGDPIIFDKRLVYLTFNRDRLDECQWSAAAAGDLGLFLRDNQLHVEFGNMNYLDAAVRKEKHITCEKKNDTTVIEIFRGNETYVDVSGRCIRLSVGPDCNILNATEKIKVESVVYARQKAINGTQSGFAN